MRLNKYLADATGMSRRAADKAIEAGKVTINGKAAVMGQQVTDTDTVKLDNNAITPAVNTVTLIINKPMGYVCSRDGQGSRTVYDLLPLELHYLKPVGRLDKESSGLLLMTNDGQLAYELTHPKFQKTKVYKIALNKPLQPLHRQMISDHGIMLDDGPSKLQLERINETDDINWKVTMSEGRNRQIRRTFESLGYTLPKLHRTQFGNYQLANLKPGKFIFV
ncbi:MAG: pseudouridine synthase [Patescibacteria group bacterium]